MFIIEHSFNAINNQVLCFLFLFFCSILLNAYSTPIECAKRVAFDRADSTIGSGVLVMWVSKNESVHSCPTTIKRITKGNGPQTMKNHLWWRRLSREEHCCSWIWMTKSYLCLWILMSSSDIMHNTWGNSRATFACEFWCRHVLGYCCNNNRNVNEYRKWWLMNRTIEPGIGNRQRFCCLDVVSGARVLRDTCCIAAYPESCPWNESFHQSIGMEMKGSVRGTSGSRWCQIQRGWATETKFDQ